MFRTILCKNCCSGRTLGGLIDKAEFMLISGCIVSVKDTYLVVVLELGESVLVDEAVAFGVDILPELVHIKLVNASQLLLKLNRKSLFAVVQQEHLLVLEVFALELLQDLRVPFGHVRVDIRFLGVGSLLVPGSNLAQCLLELLPIHLLLGDDLEADRSG